MACLGSFTVCPPKPKAQEAATPSSLSTPSRLSYSPSSKLSFRVHDKSRSCLLHFRFRKHLSVQSMLVPASEKSDLLKVMISGAPASGKGTQCEFITKKYGLVHIAAGDLLRVEIAAGTENGKQAKSYMEKGKLVPDEIVVTMVKERLFQPDVQENGWLLDGYPRSLSQATALEVSDIRPDIFILLDVSEESLVDRVVGRRLDPVTGRIYHLKYSPPENEEIAARLTQRFDDTEEKVKFRLQTYHQNLESVLGVYKDVIVKVNGNSTKEEVFAEIDAAISSALENKSNADSASMVTGASHKVPHQIDCTILTTES